MVSDSGPMFYLTVSVSGIAYGVLLSLLRRSVKRGTGVVVVVVVVVVVIVTQTQKIAAGNSLRAFSARRFVFHAVGIAQFWSLLLRRLLGWSLELKLRILM